MVTDLSSAIRRLSTRGDNDNSINSVLTSPPSKVWNTSTSEPFTATSNCNDHPSLSLSTSPTAQGYLHRPRGNSECLFLVKNGNKQDLPSSCKEYIIGVKQILARSEENRLVTQRYNAQRNDVSKYVKNQVR